MTSVANLGWERENLAIDDELPFADMIAALEEEQLDRYLGMIERHARQ